MDNSWAMLVDSTFYTMLETRLTKKLKTTYPNLYVTNSDKGAVDAQFPSVYVHAMPFTELNQDLGGLSINVLKINYQIEVTTKSSQYEASKVMGEVINIVKAMRFNINSFPEFNNETGVYRLIMRCNRLMGSGETF